MIDFSTYKEIHSDSPGISEKSNRGDREEMDVELMKQEEPPLGDDSLLFPATIIGYNFRRKKWGIIIILRSLYTIALTPAWQSIWRSTALLM